MRILYYLPFTLSLIFASACLPASVQAEQAARDRIILVVGAGGEPQYAEMFEQWAERWREAAQQAGAELIDIAEDSGPTPAESPHHQRLEQAIKKHVQPSLDQSGKEENQRAEQRLWLVLIGHGTYLNDVAKFNLQGPDVSGKELAGWLAGYKGELVLINCAASSGPFIDRLSAPGRVIITATQSGSEQNFARFGDYFSRALTDSAADLDHDRQISLLESFLSASAATAAFYESDARLVTEHPLMDDNGDSRGSGASLFRGVHPKAKSQSGAAIDGAKAGVVHLLPGAADEQLSAEQSKERDELLDKINALRAKKHTLDEEEYYQQLQPLLVRLAKLYRDS